MSMHSFDPIIAAQVGVVPAVIYQNITFWHARAAANGKHQHDGRTWVYNSVKAWGALFPYLTPKQIRGALEKLEEAGLVATGCYNQTPYDRTKWYCPLGQLDLPSGANEIAASGQPIPVSKPDIKPVESLSAEPTPTPQAQSRDGEITLAVKAYNTTAERCGLPHVRKLTAARLSKLRARLKDCGGLDGWRDALAKLEASTHCTGGNDRGWRACLDFLLQESSFVKLIEGAYDDKRPKYTNGAGEPKRRNAMNAEPGKLYADLF